MTPALRVALSAGLTLLTTACGGVAESSTNSDGGASTTPDASTTSAPFPLGTFTSCAQGTNGASGNTFLNGSGFVLGATLTVTEANGILTATYVDVADNDETTSFQFDDASSTFAALSSAGQTSSNFSGLCVQGPGDEGFYPAVFTADVGALSYTAGTAIIAVSGSMQGDLGPCGTQSQAEQFWIACSGGPTAAASPQAESSAPSLPVGTYACDPSAATTYWQNTDLVYGGGSGTLTLAQSGAEVTAQYEGDSSLAGALRFDVASATSAIAVTGQTLSTSCEILGGGSIGTSGTNENLPVGAALLSVDGSTLSLTFTGTFDATSACSGALMAGSLRCTKQ